MLRPMLGPATNQKYLGTSSVAPKIIRKKLRFQCEAECCSHCNSGHHAGASAPVAQLPRRSILAIAGFVAAVQHLPARAVSSSEKIKVAYDQYSSSYDELDGGAAADALGFPDLRKALLQQATGAVLEVGAGTGLNMSMYEWDKLASLTMLDISDGMLGQARKRAASLFPGKPVVFQQGDVVRLPFDDASFDVVVDTFSLCVFPDPLNALKEMRRVTAPGGNVLLLEHSRSDNPLLGVYQDLTAEPVAVMGKGCVWNQDLPRLLKQAGFDKWESTSHLGGLIRTIKATVV